MILTVVLFYCNVSVAITVLIVTMILITATYFDIHDTRTQLNLHHKRLDATVIWRVNLQFSIPLKLVRFRDSNITELYSIRISIYKFGISESDYGVLAESEIKYRV